MEEEPQATDQSDAPEVEPEKGDRDARNLATLCHLCGLLGLVIPLGNVIGPLLIWLLKKDEYPFVEEQGREALNFQISMTIALIVSAILVLVFIGVFLVAALALVDLVLVVVASLAASRGEHYRYPVSIRFLT